MKKQTIAKRPKKIPQDIIGNIGILKFPKKTLWITKKLKAYRFLKNHKHITTTVEKTEKFSGELRIPTMKYLAGKKTFQATYKENNCIFHFNINKTYFSPRLSNERKIIADEVAKFIQINKKKETTKFNILVMFAGINPYPIIIAKRLLSDNRNKTSNINFHIYSNELNKDANVSAKENIHLNKLDSYISLLPGNASQLPTTDYRLPKFDIILMPRPNLSKTFLKTALKLSKKETVIFYHGFGTKESVLREIKKDSKKKIGKIEIRKAGDIGPYVFRWQAKFNVK